MSETDVRLLVRHAAASGVTLWVERGQLHFKASKEKLSDDLRAALQSSKDELIGRLSIPIYRKSESPPAIVEFPACHNGFWEESEANNSFRHSTHFAVKITGKLDVERIQSAFRRLSLRHDLLRSRVRVGVDGVPLLQLADDPPAPVQIVDLFGSSPLQVKAAIERAIYAPFEDGWIYRGQALVISEMEHVVTIVIHHYVADAVTLEVVAGELLAGIVAGHGSGLPIGQRPLQYSEYLLSLNEWLSGQGLEYRLNLWKETMRGVQAVHFPLADERQRAGPRKLDVLNIHIAAQLRAKIARAIAIAEVPLPSALLAVNFAALASTFHRGDLFTMFLHMGRTEPALFNLVGFTANCFPVRVTLTPQMSYIDLMIHVHDAFVFGRDYQVPWGILMPLLQEVNAGHIGPLFNYRFVAKNATSALPPHARGFRIEPMVVEGPEPTNSVDWKSYELHATDNGVDISVTLKYMPFMYRAADVREFANTFLRSLEALADRPASCLVC